MKKYRLEIPEYVHRRDANLAHQFLFRFKDRGEGLVLNAVYSDDESYALWGPYGKVPWDWLVPVDGDESEFVDGDRPEPDPLRVTIHYHLDDPQQERALKLALAAPDLAGAIWDIREEVVRSWLRRDVTGKSPSEIVGAIAMEIFDVLNAPRVAGVMENYL